MHASTASCSFSAKTVSIFENPFLYRQPRHLMVLITDVPKLMRLSNQLERFVSEENGEEIFETNTTAALLPNEAVAIWYFSSSACLNLK